jgi:hypothetical protein
MSVSKKTPRQIRKQKLTQPRGTKKVARPTLTVQVRTDGYREARGIEAARFGRAGIQGHDSSAVKRFGIAPALDAIVIPYKHPLRDEILATMRARYFDPPMRDGRPQRYSQPKGTPVEAYFDPNVDWPKVFKDTKTDLHIVEGEMKALALNQHGFTTIALGGVYSFGGDSLTPLLQKIAWKGRRVFIVYDSDAASNEKVRAAERRLAEVLS